MKGNGNDIYRRYKKALRSLPRELEGQDLADLFPHLDAGQALHALTAGEFIVLPPLKVNGVFHVAGREENKLILAYTGSANSPEGKKISEKALFFREAEEFARRNWPEELIADNWVSVLAFQLQDFGNGKKHAILYAALNRPARDLLGDFSRPLNELTDAAIIGMTLDPVIGREMEAGKLVSVTFNCAHCGSSLYDFGCPACKDKAGDCYNAEDLFGSLPAKAIDFLRSRHYEFSADPSFFHEAESERFGKVKEG